MVTIAAVFPRRHGVIREMETDGPLGFTGGVMLAATAFSLLVPALESGGVGRVLVGFVVGGAAIAALDRWVPHLHARRREGRREPMVESAQVHRARLLVIAMTIHNFPEGAAVGTAFAAGGTDLGLPMAVAIATQNLPEGFDDRLCVDDDARLRARLTSPARSGKAGGTAWVTGRLTCPSR